MKALTNWTFSIFLAVLLLQLAEVSTSPCRRQRPNSKANLLAQAYRLPQGDHRDYGDGPRPPPYTHIHKDQKFPKVQTVTVKLTLGLPEPLQTAVPATTADCSGNRSGDGGDGGNDYSHDGNQPTPPLMPLSMENSSSTFTSPEPLSTTSNDHALSLESTTSSILSQLALALPTTSPNNPASPPESSIKSAVPQFTLAPTPLSATISEAILVPITMSAAPPGNPVISLEGCNCACLCDAAAFKVIPPGGLSPSMASMVRPPPPPPTNLTPPLPSGSSRSSSTNLLLPLPTTGSTSTPSDLSASTILSYFSAGLPTSPNLATQLSPSTPFPNYKSSSSTASEAPTGEPTTQNTEVPSTSEIPFPSPFNINTLSLMSAVTFRIDQPPPTATINVGA
ncbi:hypothetical protein FGG08_006396 [Glutinoglossum americanum]|uniref:Uncharacterized protein n=1 Tax=Glutinoglossum americanum TaxID=1670608 RepID=A0A9P8KXI8_9PEZI|nr:hypothetical protein FGG08_006396 [Glutinoglossum americanum]